MAEVDQAVVDEILAKAAEDTEEGRLEKLEKEVETLKGSIKRLLLDIRETMNKLENPFANLQSLAESTSYASALPTSHVEGVLKELKSFINCEVLPTPLFLDVHIIAKVYEADSVNIFASALSKPL